MKEYLYRKKVKYQCRPVFIALDLLVALVIIFSGPFLFAANTLVVALRIAVLNSEVEYLLPRRLEDIKKQSYTNAIMICSETLIFILLWLIPSGFLYKGLSVIIREFPIFIALWLIAIALTAFRHGLDEERKKWAGVNEDDITFSRAIVQELSESVVGFLASICVFFNAIIVVVVWMEKVKWNFHSPIILGILLFSIIIIFVDICRNLKKWEIADYIEQQKVS